MNSFFNVIKFTFKNKAKSKAFLITSIILVVILSVVINLPYIIQSFSSDEPKKIGMFDDSSEISTMLAVSLNQQEEKEFEIVFLTPTDSKEQNDELVKAQIADEKIEGFLELENNQEGSFPNILYKSRDSLEFSISSKLGNALSNIKTEMAIKDLDLSAEQRASLFEPINIENVQISASGSGGSNFAKSEGEMFMAYGMVYVLMILLFMGIMISGQLIASDITAEKSSRVMEILVTSVTPLKQMFGKIIGMFLIGLSQIALFVIVAVINLSLPHNKVVIEQFNLNLNDIDPVLLAYFIVFYLLGFFLFATIFAAVGSLVSRTEDLGQAIMPVTILSLASFYIGIFGLAQPTSAFITAMSFIPFFSPNIMFIRIGMADPALWEIILSLAILLATIFFMGWLSAKIYRTGVLMYGKRPTIKELRKAMKAFKV